MNLYKIRRKKLIIKDNKQVQVFDDFTVRIPTHPTELQMKHWNKFHLEFMDLPQWFRDINFSDRDEEFAAKVGKWSEAQWIEFYVSIARLLASISPEAEQFEKIINADFQNAKDGDGIFAMYAVLCNCIFSYQPKVRSSFEFKRNEYFVPKSITDQFKKEWYGASLTTIESIEALHLAHVLNGKKDDGEYALEDRKYRTDLALLAALCRKKLNNGELETIPLDFIERRKWMDKRMRHFENVTFDIALDIDFFLSNSLAASKIIRSSNTLSILMSLISPKKSS